MELQTLGTLHQQSVGVEAPLKRMSSLCFDEKLFVLSLYKFLVSISETAPIILYIRDIERLVLQSPRCVSLIRSFSMRKKIDRKAILAKAFKYTHTLKANKERFANERRITRRGWRSQPNNLNRLVGMMKPAPRPSSLVGPNRVWRETASESHKNRYFELDYSSPVASTLRLPLLLPLPPALPIPKKFGAGGSRATGRAPISSPTSPPQQGDHDGDDDDYRDL
ncbi:uncharacterized protein DS421_9g258810 [Arachis hypogaea]|nr:uncharacterized protein DS421_9g258810 [Arachis hypogaea]